MGLRRWGWSGVAVVAACGGGSPAPRAAGDSTGVVVAKAPGAGEPAARAGNGGAAVNRSPVVTANSTGRATIVFMGTSLTAGYGLEPAEAYPAVLQRRADSLGLAVRVVNAGLSGETSAGALRRVDWVLRGPADAFVLETGANDGLRGLDVDSTRANITAVLRRVRAARPGAALFLVQMEAPPNMGPDYTRRFREIYPAVARAEGATLIPFLLADVAGRAALNQADGIHPTAAGARRVAETLWAVLGPVFQQLDASVRRA